MKNIRINILLVLLMAVMTAGAQQVSTLYFLENAPMRHTVNPAFQPVSEGYVNFTPLGFTSMWIGNNSLTMSDAIYAKDGKTITAVYPGEDRSKLMKAFRKGTLIDGDMTFDLVSFGFRHKDNGYIHINIMERIEAGTSMPKDLFGFVLDGGMKDLNGGINTFNLRPMGLQVTAYTEIAGGYSYKINDQWTVGGKIKFLLGQAYAGFNFKNLNLNASTEQWTLEGNGSAMVAAPIDMAAMPERLTGTDIKNADFGNVLPEDWKSYLKPSGYGAAIDLGFTYKPIEQLQISAALNDLGFIYWTNAQGRKYNFDANAVFDGAGEFAYNHYVVDGKFDTDSLMRDVTNNLEHVLDGVTSDPVKNGFARMLSAKLNVGIDANFCDNKLGVGIVSKTRLFNNRVYEEVTIGGAVRPCNWFNFALSYSLVNNGKYSNIGAGLSFMPYDGINMTLAMDYIPTSYVPYTDDNGKTWGIPNKTKGVNVALGFSIVWGTNKKDKDKDGILDQFDMCPNTPVNVQVDELGCPIDSDGDGVPDYLDECPGTPKEAYGFIDEKGCELDTDSDGVADWKDECPNTLPAARAFVDEKGCDKDSDGDGVPDWKDQCPNTPAEARGYVDEKGCELDSDGDGVPDWRDECPNTPAEARATVDEKGCEADSDGDGVPDWKDECPNTPAEARGHVDERGCELDTDGDGVPDWKDECPTVPGPDYNKGCPAVKKEIRTLLNKAMQGIQFETGKDVIKPASYKILDQVAKTFIESPEFTSIEVQGHTDNVGNAQMNKDLSDRRAHAVRNYLIKKGVAAERLTAHGYGMDKPIADNKTKAGRAKNRRVEFSISFEEVNYETELQHVDSTLYQKHLDDKKAMELKADSLRQAADALSAEAKKD